MGLRHAEVEAHVKSLSPLNETLVSEVHIDGSVIQNDTNASILCRSQKGGSSVAMQVIAALIASSPPKKVWCLLLELFIQPSSWLQITLSYSGTFEKLPVPFIAPSDAQKTISMCFFFLPPPFSPPSPPVFCFTERLSWLPFCWRNRAEQWLNIGWNLSCSFPTELERGIESVWGLESWTSGFSLLWYHYSTSSPSENPSAKQREGRQEYF